MLETILRQKRGGGRRSTPILTYFPMNCGKTYCGEFSIEIEGRVERRGERERVIRRKRGQGEEGKRETEGEINR